MSFSFSVQTAFDGWINVGTWYTSHPADEERFYRFVWAAVMDSSHDLNEAAVRNGIEDKWRGKLAGEQFESAIDKYVHLYASLFEFGRLRPQ